MLRPWIIVALVGAEVFVLALTILLTVVVLATRLRKRTRALYPDNAQGELAVLEEKLRSERRVNALLRGELNEQDAIINTVRDAVSRKPAVPREEELDIGRQAR